MVDRGAEMGNGEWLMENGRKKLGAIVVKAGRGVSSDSAHVDKHE
jgi:hypothetical protein